MAVTLLDALHVPHVGHAFSLFTGICPTGQERVPHGRHARDWGSYAPALVREYPTNIPAWHATMHPYRREPPISRDGPPAYWNTKFCAVASPGRNVAYAGR